MASNLPLIDNSVRLALQSVEGLPDTEALRVMALAVKLLRTVNDARERNADPPALAIDSTDNPSLAGVLAELLAIEGGSFKQAIAVGEAAIAELLRTAESSIQ